MRDAVSLYGRAVIDLYEEWFSLVLANFACFFCFLPGLAVIYALIWIVFQAPETGDLWVGLPPLSVIAVLTGGPALGGIHNLTNPLSHERRIDTADFWDGFKKYYVKSWLILGLWMVVAVTLAVNVWFYRMWWQQGTQIALLPVVLFLWQASLAAAVPNNLAVGAIEAHDVVQQVLLVAWLLLAQTIAAVAGHEDLLAQRDRTRTTEARQGCLPDDVLSGAPGGRHALLVGDAAAVRATKLGPVGSGEQD